MAPETTLIADNKDAPNRIELGGPIRMQPDGALAAFIYAPLSHLPIQPKEEFAGIVWADSIQIQSIGDIFVDTSIRGPNAHE